MIPSIPSSYVLRSMKPFTDSSHSWLVFKIIGKNSNPMASRIPSRSSTGTCVRTDSGSKASLTPVRVHYHSFSHFLFIDLSVRSFVQSPSINPFSFTFFSFIYSFSSLAVSSLGLSLSLPPPASPFFVHHHSEFINHRLVRVHANWPVSC